MEHISSEPPKDMKALESALMKETVKIEEILHLIDISWNDPGAELIKKRIAGQLHMLEEQRQILRNTISRAYEKRGYTNKGEWEKEEQKQED